MKGFNKDQAGTASVLVVFMMILLVTFGSMALSASLSNQRLGALSAAWLTDYYWMDSEAELGVFAIDQILAEAEQRAQVTLQQLGFDSFATTYINEVRQGLAGQAEQRGWELTETPEGMQVSFTIVNELRTARRTQDKYLTVEVISQVPQYDRTEIGWQRRENTSRFTIGRWQQWQELIRINTDIVFWDGTFAQ